jgi:hypothetical protein
MNRTLAQLPRVPSLAFVHVPVPEFMAVWSAGLARGSKHEDVNCPMHDSGAAGFPCRKYAHAPPAGFLAAKHACWSAQHDSGLKRE